MCSHVCVGVYDYVSCNLEDFLHSVCDVDCIKCVLNPTHHTVCVLCAGGNQDGKFSVGFRNGVVRTVVDLDRETQASYTLVIEAIGEPFHLHPSNCL